ncbi:MAG: glutamine-hydrolyzing GMP synthase, partial [Ginsengibacter sp.]
MAEKILIVDFGSQYTQLIARAVREINVYCEIISFNKTIEFDGLKGIILAGSPFSVNDDNAPLVDIISLSKKLPVLGICYGAQLTAKQFGGLVENSDKREYGRAVLKIEKKDALLKDLPETSQVWMSHADTIKKLPEKFELLGTTESIPVAAFKSTGTENVIYGLQFHPEVYHSAEGKKIIKNFLVDICGCEQDWTPAHFITDTIEAIKKQVGDKKVIMAFSGGVDSTVAATLIHKAIGKNLFGIFVDNGLLRKDEFEQVLSTCKGLGLNIKGVDAKDHFYAKLAGKIFPEEKRKSIGKSFIEIFDQEAHKITGIDFLAQGTIYPDVIESVSV